MWSNTNIWVLPWTNRCRAVEVHWELSVWEREPSRSCYLPVNNWIHSWEMTVAGCHTQTCICFCISLIYMQSHAHTIPSIYTHTDRLSLARSPQALLQKDADSLWSEYDCVHPFKDVFKPSTANVLVMGLLFVCWLDLDLLEWGSLWTYSRLMSHLQMLWRFELVFELISVLGICVVERTRMH